MKTETILPLEKLVAATQKLYSPPLIYQRLNEAINHPRTSMQDIARIVSEDQGLTARLLKIANSPLYGFGRIDSIQRAITLIGTREIRDLALAIWVMLKAQDPSHQHLRLQYHWRHSIYCAAFARNIAFFLREPNIERFFVAGILHNLGRLIFCLTYPDKMTEVFAEALEGRAPLYLIERQIFGYTHAQLGGELLKKWQVPQTVHAMVTFHPQPLLSAAHKQGAAIIHLADFICQTLGYGPDPDMPAGTLDTEAIKVLSLPLKTYEQIIAQSDMQVRDLLAIFQDPA